MNTVYGPVPSWRLGRSLGIDPVCNRKVCSFDCSYCQLGRTTEKTVKRRAMVKGGKLRKDLEKAWKRIKGKADIVTLSGTGEPELAENLGELIEIAGEVTGLRVAVLTNSSLMHLEEVREDLAKADVVVAKLDAARPETFEKINRPHESLDFAEMVEGMREFRKAFGGKYAIQMMFMKDNMNEAPEMRELAETMKPDEIQIDTPLRKPSGAKPLDREEMYMVGRVFYGMKYISVYEKTKPRVEVMDKGETEKRRPSG